MVLLEVYASCHSTALSWTEVCLVISRVDKAGGPHLEQNPCKGRYPSPSVNLGSFPVFFSSEWRWNAWQYCVEGMLLWRRHAKVTLRGATAAFVWNMGHLAANTLKAFWISDVLGWIDNWKMCLSSGSCLSAWGRNKRISKENTSSLTATYGNGFTLPKPDSALSSGKLQTTICELYRSRSS